MNRAFKKGTPSIFILNSPFQAICMREAINELCIDEFKIILCVENNPRDKQLYNVVDSFGYKYEIIDNLKVGMTDRLSLLFDKTTKGYKRAFIGYYDINDFWYLAFKNISNGADIVCLDDGLATVTLLNDLYKPSLRGMFMHRLFDIVAHIRHISINNLYTIYKGINNCKYNINYCDFSVLRKCINDTIKQGVYIIGTNLEAYCRGKNISESDFSKSMDYYFEYIRNLYKDEEIFYIPHGRDVSDLPESLCKKHKLNFKRIGEAVELYLTNNRIDPVAVYGFTSSALVNIKLMYPLCEVYDMTVSFPTTAPSYKIMMEAYKYYESFGIKTLTDR